MSTAYFSKRYQPDIGGAQEAGEKSPDLGVLGACVVCRCIASGTCMKCRAAICDSVCADAHGKLDHPRLTVVKERFCKWCHKPIGRNDSYCSKRCAVLGQIAAARLRSLRGKPRT